MAKKMRARELPDLGEVSLIPIMNLVCLLIPFLLYTAAFVHFAVIDVQSPRFQNRSQVTPPDDSNQEALNLMLLITDEGFRLAASGGVLPEGCASSNEPGATSGPTVPLNPNAESCTDAKGYPSGSQRRDRQQLRLGPPACAYNFQRLHECIVRIKEEYPEERQIIISGENRIDYDILIQAMDSTRGEEDSPLFPDVVLSSGVA